jgi:hypothetical protein
MDEQKNREPQQPKEPTPAPEEKPKETIKEIHHHYHDRRGGINFGRLAFGIILVFIGVVYLAQTTGWINVNINFDWWKLWPLIIIIIGLSMLSGRGWLSGTIGLVVLIAILIIVGLLLFSNNAAPVSYDKTITITKEATATTATIDIKAGAGTLKIGNGSEQLVAGTFESNVTNLTTNSTLDGTNQTVNLKEDGYTWHTFGNHVNNLDVSLYKDIPLKLTVSSGAMDMNLDLADLMAESVNIDTGASSMKLALGDKVTNSIVSIDAGASSLTFSLPKTVGVKFTIDSGLSSKNLPDFNKIDEKHYQTNGYDAAQKKIDINLKMGVSSLSVTWR